MRSAIPNVVRPPCMVTKSFGLPIPPPPPPRPARLLPPLEPPPISVGGKLGILGKLGVIVLVSPSRACPPLVAPPPPPIRPKLIVDNESMSVNGFIKFMPSIIKLIAPINELANNSKPAIKLFKTKLTTFLKPSNFVYATARPVISAAMPRAIRVNGLAAIAKLTAKIAVAIALIVPAINKNATSGGAAREGGTGSITPSLPSMPSLPPAIIGGGSGAGNGKGGSGGSGAGIGSPNDLVTIMNSDAIYAGIGQQMMAVYGKTEGITINVTGGVSTSAEIGQSVYNALLQYKQVYGPLTAIAT